MDRQRRKTVPRKKRQLVIDENVKRFFPPVSRMDGGRSPGWGWRIDVVPEQKRNRLVRQKSV